MALLPLGIWAASGAGGAAGGTDFQLISTQLLASTAASVTFSSIPSTYRHLQLRITLRDTFAVEQIDASMRFNSDNGNNYSFHYLKGNGSAASSLAATGYNRLDILRAAGSNATTGIYVPNIVDILDYSQTTKNKVVRLLNGGQASSSTYTQVALNSGLWMSTTAINSINIYSQTLAIGSRFSLYGWN
jgi:hypothetical protein